jgi:acetyltransferase-like isoleucine patch superfamily enzyme
MRYLCSIINDDKLQLVFKRFNFLNNFSKNQTLQFYSDTLIGKNFTTFSSPMIHSLGHYTTLTAPAPAIAPIATENYCSLGENLLFFGLEHPYTNISTSPFVYKHDPVIFGDSNTFIPLTEENKKTTNLYLDFPVVMNDVWIGRNVMLKRGITLHNGCVVGAGSVVTKDVPPYAIVAGNPARIIKYRFDDNIIEQLLNLRWFDYCVKSFKGVDFNMPIQSQIDQIMDLANQGSLVSLSKKVLLVDVLSNASIPFSYIK